MYMSDSYFINFQFILSKQVLTRVVKSIFTKQKYNNKKNLLLVNFGINRGVI